MARNLRGSGVRHTFPMVGRFAGLWLIVTLAAVGVAAASAYMLAERGGTRPLLLMLETGLIVGAVAALAVFTTHRLAGPWIAVRRALDRVRDGDLDTPLRIRTVDPYLRDVERSFNEMRESLRHEAAGGRSEAASPRH
jgi:nitrogen fixation/metabolism regulation signal transduction histidine kinase